MVARWTRDFYRSGHRLMAVSIETQPGFAAGTPQTRFEERRPLATGVPSFDFAPDGRRFLVAKEAQESEPIRLHVVLNWTEELKRLVPTN